MSRKFLLLMGVVGACGGDDAVDNGSPDGGVTGDACTGAGCTPQPDAYVPVWEFRDVHGVPNLDDDDGSQADWPQPLFAADDDLSKLTILASSIDLLPAGTDVQLMLAGDLANVRVFHNRQHVLGVERGAGPYSFTPTAGADAELEIEFGDYGVAADLTVTGGSSTTTVKLQASPLIMNHHLQPADHVWAVAVNGNASFIAAYQQALGSKFTAVSGATVASDVWMQDEFEFATSTGEGDERLDTVIDSIRDRGLDNYAESQLVGPDMIAATWGNPAARTSYDSFGNLEASPPVTVNGVSYPFGKIYYGRVGTSGLSTQLGTFLASQRVQAPFQLPTNWLCVGHVDEFSSTVPDPSSPKGFKLVIADTTSAWPLLQTLSASATLPKYGQDHGYATVGALLADTNLRALNNEIQTDYLEPIIAKFKTELGLTDADIIRLPSLFEQVSGCNGRVAALIPGMANLIVAKTDGSTTHLFTADPFFRASADQSTDPVISAFRSRMPAGMQLHFIDDWDVYHVGLGEVHCGTNVQRTPTANWWTDAQHLMGGN